MTNQISTLSKRYEELFSHYILGCSYVRNPYIEHHLDVTFGAMDNLELCRISPPPADPNEQGKVCFNILLVEDETYRRHVQNELEEHERINTAEAAKELGLDICDVVARYLAWSVEYGHTDPHVESSIRLDQWGTFAGSAIFIGVYRELDEQVMAQRRKARTPQKELASASLDSLLDAEFVRA